MARIDLKDAIIRILDGYSATALVDNGGGYSAGAVTMTISDSSDSAALPVGAAFMVEGDDQVHIVTARSGGPPSTSITFTPALRNNVSNDAPITFLGRALEVNIGSGNLTYSEKITRNYELNRGALDTVKDGDEQPIDVSMDFIWDFLTAVSGSGTPTVEDALKNRGEASGWVSSATDDPCAPYAVDIMVEYIPPCSGVEPELIVLPDFRYEELNHDFTNAQVACTGKCNAVEAIVSRPATS